MIKNSIAFGLELVTDTDCGKSSQCILLDIIKVYGFIVFMVDHFEEAYDVGRCRR